MFGVAGARLTLYVVNIVKLKQFNPSSPLNRSDGLSLCLEGS